MANAARTVSIKLRLLYVLAAILFFFIGLIAFFPGEVVRQRLEQELSAQLHMAVEVGETDLALPLGLTIDSLHVPVDDTFSVTPTQISIRPAWLSLFTGSPAVRLTATLWDGEITATINTSQHLALEANDLHWQGSLPQLPSLGINARLDHLELNGTATSVFQLQQATLSLAELTVTGMKSLGGRDDNLALGEVFLKIHEDNGHLQIEQLQSRNGNLVVNADGRITPGRRPELSRLDLKVTLIPQPSTDPALTDLMQLVTPADQNGHFVLTLRGSAAQPSLR